MENYSKIISSQIFSMFRSKTFTDCALSAGGESVQAHRIVLAAASPYLSVSYMLNYSGTYKNKISSQKLLDCADSSEKQPVIVLSEISFNDICNILSFIYTGFATVNFEGIVPFYNICKHLELKGIERFEIDAKPLAKPKEPTPTRTRRATTKRSFSKDITEDLNTKDEPLSSSESSVASSESEYHQVQPQRNRRNRTGKPTEVRIPCNFCPNKYNNINTLKNHQRFCYLNPNRAISRCPICKIEVKPGSMTYHKRTVHLYTVPSLSGRKVQKTEQE